MKSIFKTIGVFTLTALMAVAFIACDNPILIRKLAHLDRDREPVQVAPTITTSFLGDRTVGAGYSETLRAYGTEPITWTIVDGRGSLPPGLTLSEAGVISGVPKTDGTFGFTVRATNEAGYDTQEFSILVTPEPVAPIIYTKKLPDGIVGQYYRQTLQLTVGTAPVTWGIASGALPGGLSLSEAGVISGVPKTDGTFTFTIRATNAVGTTEPQYLSIVINTSPTITTTTLPDGFIDTAYNQTLQATGTASIIWTLTSGSLPHGLTLSTEGVISGTPTEADTFNFTVRAENAADYDTQEFAITIFPLAAVITDTNMGAILALIQAQPGGNTTTDPVILRLGPGIELDNLDWLNILTAISIAGKYIALDLSAALVSSGNTGGLRADGTFDPLANIDTGKDRIVSIILPDAATSIVGGNWGNPSFNNFDNLKTFSGAGLQTIGNYAFATLTNLNMTALPPTITTIGNSAFRGCTGLTQMTLHGGIASIGVSAFYGSGLTQVVLEEGITSIGASAFHNITPLTKVILPSTLTSIDFAAFDNCTSLSVVTIHNPIPPTLGAAVFNNVPPSLEIRVPAGSVPAYQGDLDWLAAVGGVASRIVAIP